MPMRRSVACRLHQLGIGHGGKYDSQPVGKLCEAFHHQRQSGLVELRASFNARNVITNKTDAHGMPEKMAPGRTSANWVKQLPDHIAHAKLSARRSVPPVASAHAERVDNHFRYLRHGAHRVRPMAAQIRQYCNPR